jgi:DeoR/GlpR family transcriptional regulator of sugar metabolism
MLPEERRLRILEELGARGLVRVDDLVSELDVSAETIRRDLIELERRGELSRVYGGATRTGETAEASRREVANPDAKRAIARLAASLVKPHQTLIFDVGTTVTELARALPMDLAGQALTNSLHTAQELARRPNLQLHLAGGEVRTEDLACSGPETEEFIGGFFADVAFLCAGGVHPQAGITDFYPREIAIRRHMVQRSQEQYVLADSSKIGRVALRRVCEVAGVTAIITDDDAPAEAVEALAARGVRVLVAPLREVPVQAPLPVPDSPLLDLDGPPQAFAFDGP